MKIPVLVIAILIATATSSWLVSEWSTTRGEICEKDEHSGKMECSQYSALPFIVIEITKTLDHHEGTVLGLGTLALAFFTWGLWVSTSNLWQEAIDARTVAKQSADIAFKTAMPVLSPYVTEIGHIHPLTKTVSQENDGPEMVRFDSLVFFTFDNFGKTPGIIREIRADLFLLLNDNLPNAINFDDLPKHQYEVIVPGDSKGGSGATSAIDYRKPFSIQPNEFTELLREAKPDRPFRRMAIIGRVIYDDFFGIRHTRPFCVKMRLWRVIAETHVFQAQFGASTYSKITQQEIPNPDPFEVG